MCCIQTVGHRSALKREGVRTQARAWRNIEDIMLSEISQSQKDQYFLIPLTGGSWRSHSQRQKVQGRLPGKGTGGGENRSECLIGIEFQICLFFFFAISWTAPTAYGGSQARGRIGAAATDLRQSHSNAGSEPCLQPTPHGNTGYSPHCVRAGPGPSPSRFLVCFVNHRVPTVTLFFFFCLFS